MPTSYLEAVFGRKKPTSFNARAELTRAEAELSATPARIAAAEAALKRVADMTDDEHSAAEAELAAQRRAPVRLRARIEQLRVVLAEAEKTEAASALREEAEAASKAMAGMAKLNDRFDEQAAALATTASSMRVIEASVATVNRKIETARKAGLDVPEPLKTSHQLFRSEPDRVEPDTSVVEETWRCRDENGRWRTPMVFGLRDGKEVPLEAGAELHRTTRTVPGRRKQGRNLPPPLVDLRLPATRLGREPLWPPKALS